MIDAIYEFMKQHEQALEQLRALRTAVTTLNGAGYSPAVMATIDQAAGFIDKEVRVHNQKEEETLFPALDAVLPYNGPTRVMRHEHKQLWEAVDRLKGLIEELKADPENTATIGRLSDTAHFLAQFLSDHIAKENEVLYPMARRFLTPEQMQDLTRRMEIGVSS